MERWLRLLRVHNHIWLDKGWTLQTRHDACKLIKRAMLELGQLRPLPPNPVNEIPPRSLSASK
jgi:hypothetical protein